MLSHQFAPDKSCHVHAIYTCTTCIYIAQLNCRSQVWRNDYQFCLALPATFSQLKNNELAELCISNNYLVAKAQNMIAEHVCQKKTQQKNMIEDDDVSLL